MPTYSYSCTECGHDFDVVQAFADDSLTVCPSCGGRLRKRYSAVGVSFNGSGFYRTDSRAGAPAAKTGSSAAGEQTPSSTAASKSDSTTSSPGSQD